MGFIKFWIGNFFHGGEAGEALVYKADFLLVLVGFVIKGIVWGWRSNLNKHTSLDSMEGVGIMTDIPTENNKWDRLEKWWHHWENKVVLTTSGIALVTFLFTAIAFAPYHRFEHSESEKKTVSNELTNTRIAFSNELWAAKHPQMTTNWVESVDTKRLESAEKKLNSIADRFASPYGLPTEAWTRITEKLKVLQNVGRKIEVTVWFHHENERTSEFCSTLGEVLDKCGHNLAEPTGESRLSRDENRKRVEFGMASTNDAPLMELVDQITRELGGDGQDRKLYNGYCSNCVTIAFGPKFGTRKK